MNVSVRTSSFCECVCTYLLVLIGCDGDELGLGELSREDRLLYRLLVLLPDHLHYVDPRLVLMERVQHDLRRDRRGEG